MQTDVLIEALAAELKPVQPRRRSREAIMLAGLLLAEMALFVLLQDMRPDMMQAMAAPAFWWKSGSMAAVAGMAVLATLVSLDPATTASRRVAGIWRSLGLVVVIVLASGWLIDAVQAGQGTLLTRLMWRDGVDCLVSIAVLTLPPVLALGVLVQRGAPTRPARTATAAGLAAAAIGAFFFAFHCPHDDPLYVAVWYGGAVAGIALATRLVLPRLARW